MSADTATGIVRNALVVTAASSVAFRPLFTREPERPGGDWIVGHEPSDTCIALPEAGVVAIRELEAGHTIAEAGATVRRRCGEEVDVADFVHDLAALGLIASIDGRSLGEVEHIGQRWLDHIRPERVGWLCSRPMLIVVGVLIVAGPLALLVDPGTRPQPTDVLWNPSYTIDVWAIAAVSWLLLFTHELGHLLTARAKGLRGELTIDRRLFYLVAVSRIAGIWKLPRRDRLLIYSAGMLTNAASVGVMALLIVAADVGAIALAPMYVRLLRFFCVVEYASLAWECQIFLKTDVYHIVSDWTGMHDLPERGRALLAALGGWLLALLCPRGTRGATPPTAAGGLLRPRREAAYWITAGYALIQIVGIIGSFVYLCLYLVPAVVAAAAGEMHALATGLALWNPLQVIDAVLALGLQTAFYGLLLRLVLKSWRPSLRWPWQASQHRTVAGERPSADHHEIAGQGEGSR